MEDRANLGEARSRSALLGALQVKGEQVLQYLLIGYVFRPPVGREDCLIQPFVCVL
jgi:hypothetical protein